MATKSRERRTPNDSPLLVDVRDFITTDPRSSGSFFKFADNCSSLGIHIEQTESKPYIDRTAMSARAVISTATLDRVGDVLMPIGCNLKNYTKNPVVLWAHGYGGINLPIGTSADPDGNLAVEITDDQVLATSYFSQKSWEAAQIFELIDEGVIRATSVRETPLKARLGRTNDGREILLVEEWELEEWSWCAVGVNPDAVSKALAKKTIGGKPLHESIMQSLKAVLPPKTTQGKGFTESEPEKPTMTESTTTEKTKTESATKSHSEIVQQPFGSQAISAFHNALVEACKRGEMCMKAMEGPKSTPGLRIALDAVNDVVNSLHGLHAECYSDCKSMDVGSEETETESDAAMKAFLASGQRHQWTIGGIGVRLKTLATADNCTPAQRQELADIAGGIERLLTQSKSFQPKPAPEEKPQISPEEQAKLDAVMAKLNSPVYAS